MSDIKSKIRTFLEKDLEVDISNISDSELLFTSGLIDSYSLIELLGFMESDLDYTVDFENLSVDDFDTIDALASLVENKPAK